MSPEIRWVYEPFLAAGELTLVFGTAGIGKSTFLRAIEQRLPSGSVEWHDDVSRPREGRHIFADSEALPGFATEYLTRAWLKGRDQHQGRTYWHEAKAHAREGGYALAVEVCTKATLKAICQVRSRAIRCLICRDARKRRLVLNYFRSIPVQEIDRTGRIVFANPQPTRGLFCAEGHSASFPIESHRQRAWTCAPALAAFLWDGPKTPDEVRVWGKANNFSRSALYEAAKILHATDRKWDSETGRFNEGEWKLGNRQICSMFHRVPAMFHLSDPAFPACVTP